MISSWSRGALAGVIVLALASPGWAAAAETKAGSAKEEKAESKATAKGSEEIRKIQEALKEKGEDPGAVDGIMGKKTRAAVRAFQKANGIKVTGTVDDQTAEKLGVQKSKEEKK
jgi:peptidoglycan hydrolase-like protein with peptidoglycan-binding domain